MDKEDDRLAYGAQVFWSAVVTPELPFSPPPAPGCRLHLTQITLYVLNNEEKQMIEQQRLEEKKKEGEIAPMPKHIEEFVKAKEEYKQNILNLKQVEKYDGVCFQVCIYDEAIKKRRKFVLGTFATNTRSQQKLDHFFDDEQISNLTFECKGRPHLNKKYCRIYLAGVVEAANFDMKYTELVKAAERLKENVHRKKMEQVKQRLLEQGEEMPWLKKKEHKKEEEEEEENVMEDHTQPKEFMRQGVKIINIFVGHGRRVQKGDRVTIAYKGKLDPDKNHAFDKTSLRNPYTFRVGSRKVIKGINIGVEGMTLHGKRELVIPPNRGFGATGIPEKVPPNATLYYDIELVGLVPKKKADKEIVEANQQLQLAEAEKKKRQRKQLSSVFVHEEPSKKKKKQK
jgi:FKBP-type peptidyl-prolyl cis-trans isomerase